MIKPSDVWNRHSAQWQKIGPPLRPAPEDIELLQQLVAGHLSAIGCSSPRALILGVTPEIATMRWPPHTHLLALDCHLGMIGNVWPGSRLTRAAAVCADWTRMPLVDGVFDVVVGDACFSVLGYPQGYETLNQEIRRVIKPRGLFAMRAFLRPDRPEPVAVVFDDLKAGRIGNFHILKWRLAMALHGDLSEGVRLADIWQAWNDAFPQPSALARKLDWSIETIQTMDAYRDSQTRYTFPRLEELRNAVSARFSETACVFPSYELGDRCPTFLFTPR